MDIFSQRLMMGDSKTKSCLQRGFYRFYQSMVKQNELDIIKIKESEFEFHILSNCYLTDI